MLRPPRQLPLPPGIGQVGPDRRRASPGGTTVGADLDVADGPLPDQDRPRSWCHRSAASWASQASSNALLTTWRETAAPSVG